jgi:hypothetical protein
MFAPLLFLLLAVPPSADELAVPVACELGAEATCGVSDATQSVEEELRRRVTALAMGTLDDFAEPAVGQTSPRYAAFHRPDLATPVVAVAWTAEEREMSTFLAVARALAGASNAPLIEELVTSGLATRVVADANVHGARATLTVLVFGTERAARMDWVQKLQETMTRFSATTPNEEMRRAATRYLRTSRRNVVEFLPRNAPDPGLVASTAERLSGKTTGKAGKRAAKDGAKTQSKAAPRVHPVRRGDTLIGIARRYKTTVTALVLANRLDARRRIRVGQKIVIRP